MVNLVTCSKCHETKELSGFRLKSKKHPEIGYRAKCAACDNKSANARYAANKESIRAANQVKIATTPGLREKQTASRIKNLKAQYEANPELRTQRREARKKVVNSDPILLGARRKYHRDRIASKPDEWRDEKNAEHTAKYKEKMKDPVFAAKRRASLRASRRANPDFEMQRQFASNTSKAIRRSHDTGGEVFGYDTHGFLTFAQWKQVFNAFSGCCAYCGKPLLLGERGKLEVVIEHMTPICKGGQHVLGNVVPSDAKCNGHKYKDTTEEFVPNDAARLRRVALLLETPDPVFEVDIFLEPWLSAA